MKMLQKIRLYIGKIAHKLTEKVKTKANLIAIQIESWPTSKFSSTPTSKIWISCTFLTQIKIGTVSEKSLSVIPLRIA